MKLRWWFVVLLTVALASPFIGWYAIALYMMAHP